MNIFQKNWPFSNECIFCMLLLLPYDRCLLPDIFARFTGFIHLILVTLRGNLGIWLNILKIFLKSIFLV